MPTRSDTPPQSGSGQQPLPKTADVVVIGGGIVGVTAALYLARHGVSVVLVEKGYIGAEQSSRNWGWIRKQGRDPAELPLMIESAREWNQIAAPVAREIRLGTVGTTYVSLTEAEFAERCDWVEQAKPFQLDTKILGPRETAALLGRDDQKFTGAIHTPSDMTAEPALAVPALGRLAREAGATLIEGCAARGVERSAGRVSHVVTERGAIACQSVILGGGAWSRTFLENIGIFIPQLAIRSTALRTTPGPQIHPGGLGAPPASVRRRSDGGYTIGRTNASRFDLVPAAFRHFAAYLPVLKSRWNTIQLRAGREFFGDLGHGRWQLDQITPFERTRVLDPAPNRALARDMLETAKRLHPGLGNIQIAGVWAGMIDVTPDELPIIDEIPGWAGLWAATGMSGHGFGIGPGVGRVVGELATGRRPIVDISPFALSRFSP
ncbi:NAD(P)/FAD-dependent oxidoreductase [Oceaniglobus ichthyenteri]|uniref:NAD(P)/FAD-dependent oxidoreductase n=1 Tax=Oceaniglobus ichthyenteri TaxID=2136177 RepID=UPI000D378B3E|nr:FAD-binding oxidoreductase [Oceaniglobus ichthyenteri]